ncbi:MAG: VCBS repeat-containing protein [Polyangiaceae bacterium]|nr:VCBS repeat-containing protein [Polyangiaceae bacterium]
MLRLRRAHIAFLVLCLVAPAAIGSSCTCGDGDSQSPGGSGGSGASGGGGSGGSGGTLFGDAGDAGCVDGEACGDGGICAGGVCCEADKACGAACCAAAEVCSFQECVVPGAVCVDATDCPDDSYCEYALGEPADGGVADAGCQGGAALATGKCLPKPPECEPGQEPGPNDPLTCLPKCEYKPPVGAFSPVLKYSWGDPAAPNTRDSVMMAPVVTQLDDDTCDGVVDERDIPEIVFLTFASGQYNNNGTLHAISIVNGAVVEKWTANAGAISPNHPGRSIASGNIDGVPGNEIVVCTTDQRVRAYDAAGNELWLSPVGGACFMPSIADLDHDGLPEVIVEGQILNGADGSQKVPAFDPPNTSNIVVSDMDGDGFLDIVTADRVYRADGTLIASTGLTGRYPAVGDLDKDGVPEVIAAEYTNHRLFVWHLDPAQPNGVQIYRQNVDINGTLNPNLCGSGSAGNLHGGGPPTVADFNGDGFPDAALAGGVGYAVFDGTRLMDLAIPDAQTLLWSKQTQDCSSAATGSSVFDFDGDGTAEVVYGDETTLHVYAGPDGADLFQTCNTNGTLFEYPLVADVDNDGQADIVVVSNSYSGFNCAGVKTAGVRIFGDANGTWVRTRRVWNEHGYHVTNVAEDGTIPTIEAANYTQPKLNNFRQNVQPLGEFSAPDLVVTIAPRCGADYALVARVRNIGEAAAPAGIPVGFYAGDPGAGGAELPGSPITTTKVLYPAEAEDVVLPLPDPPAGVINGTTPIYAVVDDNAPPHTWHECREDNNVSAAGSGACSTPQ